MDEKQFQQIMGRIGELRKRLLIIQVLAAVTLGFLTGVAIFRAL
ncbi:MAG: hypothetical protein WBC70_08745 [Candidatus Aminicenantales bacterium]